MSFNPLQPIDPSSPMALYGSAPSMGGPSFNTMDTGVGGIPNWTPASLGIGPSAGGMATGAAADAASQWNQKLGGNVGTANLALNGLQSIAGIWNAFKMASIAKKQLRDTRMFNTANLNNQVKAFNEQLDGRARSRAVVEGASATPGYYDRFKAEGLPEAKRK